MTPARVLLVDDDPDLCRLVVAGVRDDGFAVTAVGSAADALARLAAEDFDVVVTDLAMDGMSGLELCARVGADRPDLPVVIVTGVGDFDRAIGAIRAGAWDFITKPPDLRALAVALARAVQHRRLRDEVRHLRRAVEEAHRFDDILTGSPGMRAVTELIGRVASSSASVVITGESGTGKELVARAIHRHGARPAGPFVAVNCAAIPDGLLESELFGHVRGAFTGAGASRQGLFTQADGGTLFLDEIAELPLALQPKLLRALQDGTVRPVGSDTEVASDARVVAAANADLEAAVHDHRFREDLYFRLNVVRLHLPPLRQRGDDVLLLAQHYIERRGKAVVGLTPGAAQRLLAYPWPGNVRELQNCIERALVLARHDRIGVSDLPEAVQQAPRPAVAAATELVSVDEIERRHILRVLDAVDGNRSRASEVLGLDRKTLYRRLQRYAGRT